MRGLSAVVLLAACSGKTPAPEPRPQAQPIDAGTHRQEAELAPVTGHLDDDGNRHNGGSPATGRVSRPIDIILRSTPTSAQAAVDGIVVGPTPAYWSGNADGREHEFTFVLSGHAIARYRFVPITSGTIHARLVPVSDDVDAGTPPPEVVPPVAHPPPVQPDAPAIATPDASTAAGSAFGPMP